MEKFNDNKHNMIDDSNLEQVSGGNFLDRLHTLLFGGHAEESQEQEQTVSSDESGAWGSW